MLIFVTLALAPNFSCLKVCKTVLKPWEAVQGPFVHNLREVDKDFGETQEYPNVGIDHLGTKIMKFEFLESFHNLFESLRQSCEGQLILLCENKGFSLRET